MFDNRMALGFGKLHLTFDLGGKRIAYAYIRKNGCSTFKRALGFDPDTTDVREIALQFPFARTHDLAIFVYRDPLERMISLYKSKFVECRGDADILPDYRSVMGEEPSTFERFAEYIPKSNDPHCWPQVSHLKRLRYHAIPLNRLHSEMVKLVGNDAAEPFRHKSNETAQAGIEITPRARKIIERHFAADYRMIDRIEPFKIELREETKWGALFNIVGQSGVVGFDRYIPAMQRCAELNSLESQRSEQR